MKDKYNKIISRELLRLATAGSVDDGKSTLIGRIFFDCQAIYEDQLLAIKKISNKKGLSEIDLSLLTDGLSAEREQGITIDVAYRYLNTISKRIIVADVPGHEQYTRNMVTGSSGADLVVILVDASNGLSIQSKRHLYIAACLGIKKIIVTINKMDVVNYSQDRFNSIKDDLNTYIKKFLPIDDLTYIPISALKGDMVVNRGDNMPWYNGITLLEEIENTSSGQSGSSGLRMPVQAVLRGKNGRFYAGKVASGSIKNGQEVVILPSQKKSKIKSIIVGENKQNYVESPLSVAISLDDNLDISRGDVFVNKNDLPKEKNIFEAKIFWFNDTPLDLKKSYIFKHAVKKERCNIDKINNVVSIDTLNNEQGSSLKANDIGNIQISLNNHLIYDIYAKNKTMGSFILIDEFSGDTVAGGIILN